MCVTPLPPSSRQGRGSPGPPGSRLGRDGTKNDHEEGIAVLDLSCCGGGFLGGGTHSAERTVQRVSTEPKKLFFALPAGGVAPPPDPLPYERVEDGKLLFIFSPSSWSSMPSLRFKVHSWSLEVGSKPYHKALLSPEPKKEKKRKEKTRSRFSRPGRGCDCGCSRSVPSRASSVPCV